MPNGYQQQIKAIFGTSDLDNGLLLRQGSINFCIVGTAMHCLLKPFPLIVLAP